MPTILTLTMNPALDVFDASDPTKTNQFVTSVPLTSKVYTDASLLPTSDAYERLPRFDAQPDAQLNAQMVVNGSPGMSANVGELLDQKLRIASEKQGKCASVSADVRESEAVGENWGTRIRI